MCLSKYIPPVLKRERGTDFKNSKQGVRETPRGYFRVPDGFEMVLEWSVSRKAGKI